MGTTCKCTPMHLQGCLSVGCFFIAGESLHANMVVAHLRKGNNVAFAKWRCEFCDQVRHVRRGPFCNGVDRHRASVVQPLLRLGVVPVTTALLQDTASIWPALDPNGEAGIVEPPLRKPHLLGCPPEYTCTSRRTVCGQFETLWQEYEC